MRYVGCHQVGSGVHHGLPSRLSLTFLSEAFGFVVNGVSTEPDDPSRVVHAQLDWPPGGGVMLGSTGGRDDETWVDSAGTSTGSTRRRWPPARSRSVSPRTRTTGVAAAR